MRMDWDPITATLAAALVAIPFIIVAAHVVFDWQRRRRVQTVISLLEQAVRLSLPMPEMIRASAASEGTRTRKSLLRLAGELESGWPLVNGLMAEFPEIPETTLTAIDAGARHRQLDKVLARLSRGSDAEYRAGHYAAYRIYLCFAVLGIFVALAMLTLFVIPKFQAIFRDFRIPLPQSTLLLLEIEHFFMAQPVLTLIFFGIVIPWLALDLLPLPSWRWLDWLRWLMVQARKPPQILSWLIPPWRQMQTDAGLGEAFWFIATAVQNGGDLIAAVDDAGRMQTMQPLRLRFRDWRDAMLAGESPAAAALKAKFPPLDVGIIASGKDQEALGDALAFLSRYHLGRSSRLYAIIESLAIPAVTAVMGSIVLLVALALFQALAALMNSAGPYNYWGQP